MAGQASPTPVPQPLSSLRSMTGDLTHQVDRLEEQAPRPGSSGFLIPDAQALQDFSLLTRDIISSDFMDAEKLASQYGYELIHYVDKEDPSASYVMLREAAPIQRAWGLYVFRMDAPQGGNGLIIEAPHILADAGTPKIGLLLFRGLGAQALMIGGAHRDANPDQVADLAHNADTVFQSIHNELLTQSAAALPVVIQVHGFAASKHPTYPMIVLSGSPDGSASLVDLLKRISGAVDPQLLTLGICDGTQFESLCGETNVQAQSMPRGIFIHLELNETARAQPVELLNAFRSVLLPTPTPTP